MALPNLANLRGSILLLPLPDALPVRAKRVAGIFTLKQAQATWALMQQRFLMHLYVYWLMLLQEHQAAPWGASGACVPLCCPTLGTAGVAVSGLYRQAP